MAKEKIYKIEALHLGYSDREWEHVIAFKRQWATRKKVLLEQDSWRSLKEHYAKLLRNGQSLFLVWEDAMALGMLLLYQKPRFAPEYVFIHHDFVATYFERGLIKKVLECFVSAWPESRYLVLTSTDKRNDYLERLLSLEISEERDLFELELKRLKNHLLKERGHREENDDFVILEKTDLPVELLDDYYSMIRELTGDVTYRSKLFNEEILAREQIIKREQTYQDRGIQQLVLLILRSDELVGYTEMIISPEEPTAAYQNMTGIRSAFRGRGLGSRLKARMMQKLLDEYPEVNLIKTAIHPKNASSQGLNRQLGFLKVGTYKEYIISKASILRYVKT